MEDTMILGVHTWVTGELVTEHEHGGGLLDGHPLQVHRAGQGWPHTTLLEHGPLEVGHPGLLSLQHALKLQVWLRLVQEHHLGM